MKRLSLGLLILVFVVLEVHAAQAQTCDFWSTKYPSPTGRYLLTSASIGGNLYAIGFSSAGAMANAGQMEKAEKIFAEALKALKEVDDTGERLEARTGIAQAMAMAGEVWRSYKALRGY